MNLVIRHLEGNELSTTKFENVEQPGVLPTGFMVIKEIGTKRVLAFIPVGAVTLVTFEDNLISTLG